VDAERAGVDAGPVCDLMARKLVALSVDRFGVKGARVGLQRMLVGLSHLDDEDEPPRLGGLTYGERIAPVGRRRF
jgi:hypothetical protein